MIAERLETITDAEGQSLSHLLQPYMRAAGKQGSRPLKLRILSHLIGRDIDTSRAICRDEYERVLDSAAPGWRVGCWTPTPAFDAFATRLAAGYALVVGQEQAAREAARPPVNTKSRNYRRRKTLKRRKQQQERGGKAS